MGERRTRSSRRTGARNENSNRNVRSINNSREVSRRSKGKNRYAYEDDRRRSADYYDEDEYYRMKGNKAGRSGDHKKKQRREAGMENSSRRKNSTYDNRKNRKQNNTGNKKMRRRGRRTNGISKTIGILLAIVQFVLSVILVVNVLFFDMLTMNYILILCGALLILLGITLLSQIGAKGKGILGKLFSIFMCVVLGMGSFYVGKLNNAFLGVVDSRTKTSSMVVAVLKEDKAQTIEDARNYTFGVQYTTGGDQARSAVSQIEKDLGTSIETMEYNNMSAEAQALYSGEVDAILYNEGYAKIIEEQHPTFEDDVRIIYRHSIVVEIENDAASASMTEPFAVYLSGIDVYGDITTESRSDVNIIAYVNPTSHQVLLITTPRDYYIPIPGISNGQNDKLTHAGLYGVDVSMATLGELYEMDINFFGRVNFTSMIDIVNALGGLDVESDQEFTTSANSEHVMDVKLGINHFNGEETLAFCRERENLPGGDNDRGRHQQAVITAIIKKMMSPAMLRGAAEIIDSVSAGIDTNFSMEQIQSLIKTQLRTNADWNIYSVSAEGEGSRQPCFSSGSQPYYVTIPDDNSVANIIDLVNRVEAGEILEGATNTGK